MVSTDSSRDFLAQSAVILHFYDKKRGLMKEKEKKTARPVLALPLRRMEITLEKENMRVLIEGVTRVLTCTEERVELLGGLEKIAFTGKALSAAAYVGGALEIVGEIQEISFPNKSGETGAKEL